MSKLFRNQVFLMGLLLRLTLMPFFGSHYLKDLFIPFIDNSILHLGVNPWSLSPPHYFPYGSFLYTLLFIPKYFSFVFFDTLSLGTSWLSLTVMKLPVLMCDFMLLCILMSLARSRALAVLSLYWLNPITIYINYIHGQLDVVSMSFCMLSIYYLTKRKILPSALSMGLATLCKFHVVLLIPLLLFFLWNQLFARAALRSIFEWLATWATVSLIGFMPLYLANKFFYASTSSPEAYRIFGASINFGSDRVIYIGVLLVLTALGRLCASTRLSEKGLIFGAGALFGALLLGTNTMPGWYYWVVPFYCLFFSLYLNVPQVLFWLFCLCYLSYFPLLQSTRLAVTNPLIGGLIYTLLQTCLTGIWWVIWKLVLQKEAIIHGRAKPVMLGLAGNSGAGKNYFSRLFQDIFNPENTVIVEGDDYHKWERTNHRWQDYTHLNPKANDLAIMAKHTLQLATGEIVLHSKYDHGKGTFTSPRELKPSKTVILQGLHTLYLRGLRSHLDLKIFLAPHETVRLKWKLDRDVNERGHSPEKVIRSLLLRASDSLLHIDPQRKFADWIIEYYPSEEHSVERSLREEQLPLSVRHIMWNDAPISNLVKELKNIPGCMVNTKNLDNDIDRIVIDINRCPSNLSMEEIAKRIFPNMRHITRGWRAPKFSEGLNGITQLIAISLLGGNILEEQNS